MSVLRAITTVWRAVDFRMVVRPRRSRDAIIRKIIASSALVTGNNYGAGACVEGPAFRAAEDFIAFCGDGILPNGAPGSLVVSSPEPKGWPTPQAELTSPHGLRLSR